MAVTHILVHLLCQLFLLPRSQLNIQQLTVVAMGRFIAKTTLYSQIAAPTNCKQTLPPTQRALLMGLCTIIPAVERHAQQIVYKV